MSTVHRLSLGVVVSGVLLACGSTSLVAEGGDAAPGDSDAATLDATSTDGSNDATLPSVDASDDARDAVSDGEDATLPPIDASDDARDAAGGGEDALAPVDAGADSGAGPDGGEDAAIVCRPGEIPLGGECTVADPGDPSSCLTGGNVLVVSENGYPAHRIDPVDEFSQDPDPMIPNPTSIGFGVQSPQPDGFPNYYYVTFSDAWALSTGTYNSGPAGAMPQIAYTGACACGNPGDQPGWFVIDDLAITGDVTSASLRSFTATFQEDCGVCGRIRGCVHYEVPGDAGPPNSNGTGHDGGAPIEPPFFSYTRIEVPGLDFPSGIAIGDVTGDGLNDFVVGGTDATGLNPRLYVVAQLATGGYAVSQTIPLAGSLAPIRIGDVTRDGLADVVVSSPPGIEILPQVAGGTLGAPIALSQPTSPAGIVDIDLFDVNLDGRNDVLALEEDSAFALVYFGQPSGPPAPALAYPTSGTWRIGAGDVTGDGLPDLVTLDRETGLWIHAQTADGGFLAPTNTAISATWLNDEAVGDVTGDGHADVVVTNGGNVPDSNVQVLAQKAGTLQAPVLYPTLDLVQSPVIVDVDGDGRNDVLELHAGWNAFGLLLQLPDGGLGAEETFPIDDENGSSPNLAVGDVTNDGKPDVAIAVDGAILLAVHQK
jgi:hypothetical protein